MPTVLRMADADNSPFAGQLKTCKILMEDLLRQWDDYEKMADSRQGSPKPRTDKSESNVVNNIIAFLGERGSGKSSCLYSVRQIFSEWKDESQHTDLSKNTEFLPVIDPSFFDEHHNILELFIGQLYHTYETDLLTKWETLGNAERQKLRDLHGCFAKVRQSIKFLSAQKLELPEEQEGLTALSEGVNLRLHVNGLVKAYLRCKGKRHLIISIDDIDLNISEAYRMMEQIRKYLVIPNVVVLLAAKLEQLKNNIVLNHTKYYTPILGNVMDHRSIQLMANRYLDKFIPLERRIFMPELKDYSSVELDIIGQGEMEPSPDSQFESVEFALLSLIYKKCGFLFYNYEETPSLIIPDNLRELRSLITTLYDMDDRQRDKATHNKNKNTFKHYFYTQWTHHLSEEQKEIADSILKERDLTKINKTVVTLLHEYAGRLRRKSGGDIYSELDTGDLSQIRLNEIVNSANYSENISIGDVMVVLRDLKNLAGSSRINHIVFFVTTFYSIMLYELYDEMTDIVDEVMKEINREKNNTDDSGEYRKKNFPKLNSVREYGIPNYFKIVGNGFFTLTGESFLRPQKGRKYSRELSIMNGALLSELIEDIVRQYDKDSAVVDSPEFVLRLNMAEFFMLCASRSIESRDGSYSPFNVNNWRAVSTQFYFSPFETGTKSILFDITAPFVNMIYPSIAYNRFNGRIFKIACDTRKSLINRLYELKRSKSLNDIHDLMSRCSIRNSEVLNDLYLWLVNNKDDYSTKKTVNALLLKEFFDKFKVKEGSVSGYSVRTYEYNKGSKDYHTINFTSFLVFSDFLEFLMPIDNAGNDQTGNGRVDEEFEDFKKSQLNLFNKIYRRENMLSAGTVYNLQELITILRDSKESNIPLKDAAITKVMKATDGGILSNLLVQYLADVDIVDVKILFTRYFDDELFALYRQSVDENMKHNIESIDNRVKDYEHSISSFTADHDEIGRAAARYGTQRRQVDKGLSKSAAERKEAVKELERCKSEISENTVQLEEYQRVHTSMRNELNPLELALAETLDKRGRIESQISLKENIRVEERNKDYADELAALKSALEETKQNQEKLRHVVAKKSVELGDQRKQIQALENTLANKRRELEEIEKRICTINDNIHQQEELRDSLSREEHALIQKRYEIKDSIENMNRAMAAARKELIACRNKRDTIMSALSKPND